MRKESGSFVKRGEYRFGGIGRKKIARNGSHNHASCSKRLNIDRIESHGSNGQLLRLNGVVFE